MADSVVPQATRAQGENSSSDPCIYKAPERGSGEEVDGVTAASETEHGPELFAAFLRSAETDAREDPAAHEHLERVSGLGTAAGCTSFSAPGGSRVVTVMVQRGNGALSVQVWTDDPSVECARVVTLTREITARL